MDVLIVEDEPGVREAVAHDLREAGFQVAETATAEAALAAAEEAAAASGPPPVIVTGLHLGSGLDGLALGRRAAPQASLRFAAASLPRSRTTSKLTF